MPDEAPSTKIDSDIFPPVADSIREAMIRLAEGPVTNVPVAVIKGAQTYVQEVVPLLLEAGFQPEYKPYDPERGSAADPRDVAIFWPDNMNPDFPFKRVTATISRRYLRFDGPDGPVREVYSIVFQAPAGSDYTLDFGPQSGMLVTARGRMLLEEWTEGEALFELGSHTMFIFFGAQSVREKRERRIAQEEARRT